MIAGSQAWGCSQFGIPVPPAALTVCLCLSNMEDLVLRKPVCQTSSCLRAGREEKSKYHVRLRDDAVDFVRYVYYRKRMRNPYERVCPCSH